jgi:hypothetical protein
MNRDNLLQKGGLAGQVNFPRMTKLRKKSAFGYEISREALQRFGTPVNSTFIEYTSNRI